MYGIQETSNTYLASLQTSTIEPTCISHY